MLSDFSASLNTTNFNFSLFFFFSCEHFPGHGAQGANGGLFRKQDSAVRRVSTSRRAGVSHLEGPLYFRYSHPRCNQGCYPCGGAVPSTGEYHSECHVIDIKTILLTVHGASASNTGGRLIFQSLIDLVYFFSKIFCLFTLYCYS